MIVVQRVKTEWTKRSRGAPGAVRRNAVLEAFPVPPAIGTDVLVHQVVASEESDFAVEQTSSSVGWPEAGPLKLDGSAGVHLETIDGQLLVTGTTDVWCRSFTVFPPRPSQTVLRLEVGQWGRWRLNFRLWDGYNGSEWMYQKWVVNVAYLPRRLMVDLFEMTQPALVADDMVQLSHPTRRNQRNLRSKRR